MRRVDVGQEVSKRLDIMRLVEPDHQGCGKCFGGVET